MGIVTKTSGTQWVTDWTPARLATDDGVVNATAFPTTAFTYASVSLILSSLRIDGAYTPEIFSAIGSEATILSSNSLPFTYTFYLAPNKTFLVKRTLNFSQSGSPTSHTVYIDSNSTLQANSIAQTGFTANVTKLGPGTWRLAATENDTANSAAGPTSLTITEGTVLTGSGVSGAAVAFNAILNGGTLQAGATRSFTNAITVNAAGGTVSAANGVTATFNAAPTGSGTLTVAREGSGSVTWAANISIPLNVTGVLSFDTSSRTFSGSTLSGNGTFNTASGTLSGSINGSGFGGTITGNATIAGGISSFAADFTGLPVISSGIITFTGTSQGVIGSIGFAVVKVEAPFNLNSGTTNLTGAGSAARLEFYGAGTFASGRTIAAQNSSVINLYTSSSLPSPITATVDDSTVTLSGEDTSTCTYSGAISTTRSAGNFKIRTKGTMVLSGSASGTQAGRTFALNSDSGYDGTIRVTGSGFSGASPVTLTRGILHLNRAGTIGLGSGTGLTVSSGARLACSSSGAYAAQLSGAVTLNSGAILQFGAP